ncbi:MAG TPA: hypothetical protein VGR31_14740 [Planctomycetota bacterium]|jgi:hypothetical protein|nr:hypothetical protein [Planctomycetota bacterium]
MTLTTLSTLAGLGAALWIAAALGGAQGVGVLAGFLAGAAVTGACVARQRTVLRALPGRALRSMVEGFLVKLGAVVAAVLLFVVFPRIRETADVRSFFLAFAGAVLLVLFCGTIDNARLLRAERAP